MDKESKVKVGRLLKEAEATLLVVTADRDKLAAENAELKTHLECVKLAKVMHDKGVNADVELDDLVSQLEKEAAEGHLGEITRAVDMMGSSNLSFADRAGSKGTEVGGGYDSFTSFILE